MNMTTALNVVSIWVIAGILVITKHSYTKRTKRLN